MTNRAVMQQALECIERLNMRGFILADFEDEVESAINALREALAQPEQEPVAWGVFEGNLHDMFFTQMEAQEMAALKGSHAKVRPLYTTTPAPQSAQPMHPDIKKMYEDYFDKCFRESFAPQRPWQGLTDEEIWSVVSRIGTADSNVNPLTVLSDARAIEQRLKEFNT